MRSAIVSVMILASSAALAAPPEPSVIQGHDVWQPADPATVSMDGFLGARMHANVEGRLKHMTGDVLLDGFEHRPGSHPWIGEHAGKWLHAACVSSRNRPDDRALREAVDSVAAGLCAAQMEDGYLGTYNQDLQWSVWDTHKPPSEQGGWDVWVHKYCLVGLLAYYALTGDEQTLTACRRAADLLIDTFGPEGKDILDAGTHEGMAATSILEPMVLLYQYTSEPRYLEFCDYIIERADAGPKILTNIERYFTVRKVGNGKAYEMMSNYVGLVEYWRATGDERALRAACLAWDSIASENLFLTGAPDAHEHWSEPYSLIPTGRCTETCVQVTWAQLSWQLLRATGDPRYAAALHGLYYNHLPAAQHPDGEQWCSFTTMQGVKDYRNEINCCGSSGPRGIAMIPTFAYMTAGRSIAVNLYESSTFRSSLGGIDVAIEQETAYPFDGDVSLRIRTGAPVAFALELLVPSFVRTAWVQLPGEEPLRELVAGRYAVIEREWNGDTIVRLHFDTPLVAHLRDNRFVALSKGPLVLALERPHEDAIDPDTLDVSLREVIEAANRDWLPNVDHGHVLDLEMSKRGPVSEPFQGALKPYAEAGLDGRRVEIWLPLAE